MKVDVSEIKSFNECKRKWKLSSRNGFHLRPVVTKPAFAFGTIFHEALHALYLGSNIDKVMDMVRKEMGPDDIALLAMVRGYYENVLEDDLERYEVLEIEHKFDFMPTTEDGEILYEDLHICGSIDMIVREKSTNKIFGFEHKTAKNYRSDIFLWMDEQPRVYTWALREFIAKYNAKHPNREPATLGGVFINEVKKLIRKFDYQRTLCEYPEDDLINFMEAFYGKCIACKVAVDRNSKAHPEPSYMGCNMCDFNTICQTYMYGNISKEEILDEFDMEFKVREEDHLEEKVERSL